MNKLLIPIAFNKKFRDFSQIFPIFSYKYKKATEIDSMTLKCIKKRLSCFLSKTAFNKFNKSVNSCFFVSAVSDNSDLCAAYDAEGKNAEK